MEETIKSILLEHCLVNDSLFRELSAAMARAVYLGRDSAFCAGFIAGATNQMQYDNVIVANIADNLKPSYHKYISELKRPA